MTAKRRSLLKRVRERGNVLVVTAVTTAVLAGVSAAAIYATGRERQAAVSKLTNDQLQNCLIAGRQMLLSKLKVFGVNPRELTVHEILPDGNRTKISTGHYCQGANCCDPVNNPNACKTVQIVKSSLVGASRKQVRDVGNVGTASGTLGGQYYSVTMLCEMHNRQAELEFMFRYGI